MTDQKLTAKEFGTVDSNEETTAKKLGGVTGKGFLPGQSGNPSGRPKKTLITDVLEEMLAEKLADPAERQAFKDAHWKKMMSNTVVSSMTLEKVLDRTEGKVSQPVQVSGELTVSLSDEIRKARQRAEEGKD
jgi:hypothetical protein